MSNLNGEAQFVRIIKKKGHHGGHHGGAWKVAYADFVTAMMALFIVLWIMAQSQSIRQNVAQYFKDPGLLPHSQGLMENSNIGGEMPTPGHSQQLQRPAPAPAEVIDDQKRLEETKKKIQEMLAQLPELTNLKDQVRFELTDEGLRIELMEKENARFFEVGSAKINQDAKKIFGVISEELGVLPNRLTIEGHTDSRPYGSQSYTNWELSADRANAARRLMGDSGVKPDQISEVRGYADRRLFVNDNPNDDRNRRVSIIVNYLDKDKQKALTIKPASAQAPKKAAPPAPSTQPAPAPPALKAVPAPKLPPPGRVTPPARDAKTAQTAAVKESPPPGPREFQPVKKPLEDNVGLQKELLNLFPKPETFKIK
ncbi:MAG: flagellar motor protein MotB [Thermodesulfobacteriota bacterium]